MEKWIICLLFSFSLYSCSDSFLDAKPDKALVVPKTLEDYQALLDDVNQQINQSPGGYDVASDDLLLSDNALVSESEEMRFLYLWDREGLESLENNWDWDNLYPQILRSNIVLDGLQTFKEQAGNSHFKEVKGAALFFRAWHCFHLLQQFSKPYDIETSKYDLGIVLKLQADINEKVGLSTVEDCYKQILSDLEEALHLLSKNSQKVSRPNLTAAYAFLARVYLSRFDYDNALKYADLALQIKSDLLDFNKISHSFPDIFNGGNAEIIFYAIPIIRTASFNFNGFVNKDLVNLYGDTDLRKEKFFNFNLEGIAQIKTSYFISGLPYAFSGLLTTEQYLIKAECLIRRGDIEEGVELINQLHRFRMADNAPFVELEVDDKEEGLKVVLEERRRELFMKGLRWYDLRRLNKDERFKRILKRKYDGKDYYLEPNSDFYAFPIPSNEIRYNLHL